MKYLVGLIAVLLLAGWGSRSEHGYIKFYEGDPAATPQAVAARRASPAPAVPTLMRSDGRPDYSDYARHGYFPIGASSFSSGNPQDEADALTQGSKIGADLVLVVTPVFEGTRTMDTEDTRPTTSTSQTTSSGTAYGPGGSVTGFANSTTTTRGQTTTRQQSSADRYIYTAVYFVKEKFSLGVLVRDLNDDERQLLQTNKGVYVHTVVNDTPAYDADILVGDIILEIEKQPVKGGAGFGELIKGYQGRHVRLKISRRGQEVIKDVQLAN